MIIKPGEYILVRVYLDADLGPNESCDDEILFDDFKSSIETNWTIELVNKPDSDRMN